MPDPVKIPQNALQFVDPNCFATVDGNEAPILKMVAYSGGVIKNHWWWGDLAIDLQGMKFPKKNYPILVSHDTSRKIAFTGKPKVGQALEIDEESTVFVDTPEASEFIKLSKAGFPYESSIFAQPTAVERLEKGVRAEVNGYTIHGPASIWRQSIFKEASVCVFGYDANTQSKAFSNEIELNYDLTVMKLENTEDTKASGETLKEKEVKNDMPITLEEFKKENPDAIVQFASEVRAEVEKELKAQFEQERQAFSQEKANLQDRVLKLEKQDLIRTEAEIKSQADNIWSSKLSQSKVPDYLHDKVGGYVSHTKFVKEGKLDVEAFSKAIDEEITDWESRFSQESVKGVGFTKRKETDITSLEQKHQENDKLASDLLRLVGQKVA